MLTQKTFNYQDGNEKMSHEYAIFVKDHAKMLHK